MPALALHNYSTETEGPLTPDRVLSSVFGFEAFRPGQREIIDSLLSGTDTLAVMPTGAGKSLCYQVPALIFERPTVVVSPLVALMDNQVLGLRANGVNVSAIHSGQSREDNVAQWRWVVKGGAKLLYLSPERLMTDRMLSAMRALEPAMFVVDEAHCVSRWGPAFRPEYADLGRLKQICPDAVIGAFTATADAVTRKDIAAQLFSGRKQDKGRTVVHGFDRPNLDLAVRPKANRRQQVADFLKSREGESGIVYCLSRKNVEEMAAHLQELGVKAIPYHAGLDAQLRFANQERFMAEEAVVMVATIAFGMGIDKPDIRFVVHANLPSSMEAYYQEIGRAGRDGAPASTLMLYGMDDVRLRRQFITQEDTDPDHQARESKRLDALLAYCETPTCRRQVLLAYFGETIEPCGNCDNCLDPPARIDATREARALLAAIAQTGERFGQAHVADVARGAKTKRIQELGHDRLDAHGKGGHHTKAHLQGILRQMVGAGLVFMDIERYGALRILEPGREVLEGRADFTCREVNVPEGGQTRGDRKLREARRRAVEDALSARDRELLSRLKVLRTAISGEIGKPAYIVFSDATLMDMARKRPIDAEQMLEVTGVGPSKLEKFGARFLELLQAE